MLCLSPASEFAVSSELSSPLRRREEAMHSPGYSAAGDVSLIGLSPPRCSRMVPGLRSQAEPSFIGENKIQVNMRCSKIRCGFPVLCRIKHGDA